MLDTLKDWLGTFWKILVSPTPKTFLAEAKKAHGKSTSGLGWLVFYAIYLYALTNIVNGPTSFVTLITVVILLPLAVVLLTSAMHYSYQRIAHRRDYLFDGLLYLTIAILVPLQFIFALAALLLPGGVAAIVLFLLLVYQAVLLAFALKTLAKIEYWQALLSVLIAIIAAILVSGVVVLLIYTTVANPGITR